jgi:hypothetical protein
MSGKLEQTKVEGVLSRTDDVHSLDQGRTDNKKANKKADNKEIGARGV